MSEHAEWAEAALRPRREMSPDEAGLLLAEAQVRASLAIAAELRIANQLAYAGFRAMYYDDNENFIGSAFVDQDTAVAILEEVGEKLEATQ